MNSAIGFALLSLAAAGCLDVTFKGFSRKTRSRGMYVFACGFVWSALQFAWFVAQDIEPSFDRTTLAYGIAGGLLIAAANILLIECLTHLDVSLGSTIYRLNTIGVVVLSFLLLDEPLGVLKAAGVLCGIVAVWMLYTRKPRDSLAEFAQVFFWVAVFASLLRALFGIVAKAGLQAGADASTLLLIYSFSWVGCGIVYAFVREKRVGMTWKKLAYGLVSGFLLSIVANALILALEKGDVSVVAPVANLSFIVALLISAAIGMERLNARKGFAIATAILSIFLLAQSQ
jgi:drug/metabolite transporter (DMT)-like permease